MGTRKQTPDILGTLLGNPGVPKGAPAAPVEKMDPAPEATPEVRTSKKGPEMPTGRLPDAASESPKAKDEGNPTKPQSDPAPPVTAGPSVQVPAGEADNVDEAAAFKGHFVTFRVADRRFAFPLERVERVVRMVALIPVPEAPEWISGLFNLHGDILPVISLRKRLGLPPQEIHPDDRILVMNARNRRVGLIAEVVEAVMEISEDHWTASDGSLEQSQLLEAVIRKDEAVYLVLSADDIGSRTPVDLQRAVAQQGIS